MWRWCASLFNAFVKICGKSNNIIPHWKKQIDVARIHIVDVPYQTLSAISEICIHAMHIHETHYVIFEVIVVWHAFVSDYPVCYKVGASTASMLFCEVASYATHIVRYNQKVFVISNIIIIT